MVTIQEYLDKEYPTIEKRKRAVYLQPRGVELTSRGSEDLSDFVNLKRIDFSGNNLTSIDFLKTIPNPEKLEELLIHCNNIQPTDIEVFKSFVNLKVLQIGNTLEATEIGRHNKFYGSFESWKNLDKLTTICIEATDVNTGLEYLPLSFAELITEYTRGNSGRPYTYIQCSSHGANSGCSQIQNELRPFNYDLQAWQLAHPEKMLISRPELFINSDNKDKWLGVLDKKIGKSERELLMTKTQESEKLKKIARLESQLAELRGTKQTLEKSTQTDLTGEDIKKALEAQKQLQLLNNK